MTSNRDAVLTRIRAALGHAEPVRTTVPRAYDRRGGRAAGSDEAVEMIVDRLVDYRAGVHRATREDLPGAIDEALGDARSVVVPPGLEAAVVEACRQQDRTVTVDGDPGALSSAELDRIDAVVTAARVAIAISGTIILDGSADQGRRAITLVPDRHVIILRRDQVMETVPEALALLEPTRPLTMIAGPSATSDIELTRVEGVHGPRNLQVIIVD